MNVIGDSVLIERLLIALAIMSCGIIGWTLDSIMCLAGLIRQRYGILVLFIVMYCCFAMICSTMFLLAKYMQNLLFDTRDANFILFGGVIVLYFCLTTIFAESFLTNIIGGNPRFFPQQEPSTIQGVQAYSPSMLQLSMERNQPIYPIPQQSMMQLPMMPLPMMQVLQSPFLMNAMNQQKLSLLLMSTCARMMALTQLMSMQNRYQPYQLHQYSDPIVYDYGSTPAPLQQAQQPQIDPQYNLLNEMLQQQQQQAESQHKAILKQRKVQREYEMEVKRREALIKRHAEEEELEKSQKEIERQLRDEKEIRREKEKVEKQILEDQRKEMEQKEYDLKLRQEEELRFKQIEEKNKKKQNQENMKPKMIFQTLQDNLGSFYRQPDVQWTPQYKESRLLQLPQVVNYNNEEYKIQQISYEDRQIKPQDIYLMNHRPSNIQAQLALLRSHQSEKQKQYQKYFLMKQEEMKKQLEQQQEEEKLKREKMLKKHVAQRSKFLQRLYYEKLLHREYDENELEMHQNYANETQYN
ncbi:hypothetical protein QTP88_013673 [Uroleucon formosanum]